MEIVANLVKTTLEEIEKILTTRTVVGEPITIEGATLDSLSKRVWGKGVALAAAPG